MNILGIDWGEHDSAASLLQNGHIVAAAEEERFNRLKHAPFAFPLKAARYCLAEGGIQPDDLDVVAFSFSPSTGLGRGLVHATRYFPSANFIGLAEMARRLWYLAPPLYAKYFLKLSPRTRSVCVPHHLAHAASAFFVSPFEEAAVLVVDGMGEWPVTSLYHASDNQIRALSSVSFPHSLGFYYSAFTEYLGFEPFDGEYKVMGMAAYGQPRFEREFRQIVRIDRPGGHVLDLSYFNFHRDYGRSSWWGPKVADVFGPACVTEGMPEQRFLDIAASVQLRLEQVLFHLADHLHRATRSSNLCLAGGVALNSLANGKIAREGPFSRLFIQPAANDAGAALGAALYVQHCLLKSRTRERMRDAYLGPGFRDEEMERMLRGNRLEYRELADPAETAGQLLVEGKIVGWFQGRMEFGPRALGNRSILADPRRGDMKDRINAAVKFREPFRPFAPSVPEEDAGRFFEDVGGSPFMLRVTPVHSSARQEIPAVTHVDGSARLHTVSKEANPLFHSLIRRFGEKTGVPVVLNTSFNVRGEPIVCTPREAVACFFNSGLDALILGRYLLEKRASPARSDD